MRFGGWRPSLSNSRTCFRRKMLQNAGPRRARSLDRGPGHAGTTDFMKALTDVVQFACCAAFAALLIFAGEAAAAELRVLSTGAPSAAAKALAARVSQPSGDTFAFTVGQPDTIAQQLAAGAPADVVIAPAPLIAGLRLILTDSFGDGR